MRVSFYTLGCKVNQNETGALAQLFRQNGYTLAGPDEGQPRCVAVCDRLAAPMAALMTSDSAAAAPMRRLAARRAVAWASTPRGVVGRGAVVVNTARVANTYIGDAGEVNGAALLSECALLSTTDAPLPLLHRPLYPHPRATSRASGLFPRNTARRRRLPPRRSA